MYVKNNVIICEIENKSNLLIAIESQLFKILMFLKKKDLKLGPFYEN